jgi:hypothetical protein
MSAKMRLFSRLRSPLKLSHSSYDTMLDSLSIGQKNAFDALGLGPVWVTRLAKVDTNSQGQTIPIGLVFKANAKSRSSAENELLVQMLKAASLPFDQAQSLSVDALMPGADFEVLLSFDAAQEVRALIEKQTLSVAKMVALPSLAAIVAEGKAKAAAWEALKKFLLDSR